MPRTRKWVIGDNTNKWSIGDISNKWSIDKKENDTTNKNTKYRIKKRKY